MQQSNRNKSNAGWSAVKFAIAATALWFIYRNVLRKEETGAWMNDFMNVVGRPGSETRVLLILLLAPLNWGIEAWKWKFMICPMEEVSFAKAFKAVFSGMTVSFFTPNRVGEYAGRVFHLVKADRIKATLATVIENYSQLLVTILTGFFSLAFYLFNYTFIPVWMKWAICCGVGALTVLGAFLFLHVELLEAMIRKLKLPEKWKSYAAVFSMYSMAQLLSVTGLSFLRFLVFSLQFYLLIGVFGLDLPYLSSMLMICMTYYAMAVVPTIALTEMGVRGAVAAYFFSRLTYDTLPVVAASVSLWMINVVLPAFLGVLFVFQFRLGRRQM